MKKFLGITLVGLMVLCIADNFSQPVAFAASVATATTSTTSIITTTTSLHVLHGIRSTPTPPFSGIVEGVVVATSTTSITIEERLGSGSTATSTEKTFTFAQHTAAHSGNIEPAFSLVPMRAIPHDALVSLLLVRSGKNAGEVMAIQLRKK